MRDPRTLYSPTLARILRGGFGLALGLLLLGLAQVTESHAARPDGNASVPACGFGGALRDFVQGETMDQLADVLDSCRDLHPYRNPLGGLSPWGRYNCRDFAMGFEKCFKRQLATRADALPALEGSQVGYLGAVCYRKVLGGRFWKREGTHELNFIRLPDGRMMPYDPQPVGQGMVVSRFTPMDGFMGDFVGDVVDAHGCVGIYPKRRVGAGSCNNRSKDGQRCCVVYQSPGDSLL